MKVPLTLRARPDSQPADALLVLSPRASDVLRTIEQVCGMKLTEAPAIFAVGDSFLIKLPAAAIAYVPGTLRLRVVAADFYIPVNADLYPPLLAEEMRDMTANRGIILLPEGRMQRFNPGQPTPLSAFVDPGSVRRERWQRLPKGGELADRITEITLEMSDIAPDDVIASGGAGIGEEIPRPPSSSLPAQIAGKGAVGMGKGLANLGRMLGIKSLSALGAKMMAAGLSLAPRVSEALFGKMEAGLRDLLRQFREGNIDDALRRAVPLDREGRNPGPAANLSLPIHNLLYSLANILPQTGGVGGAWFASGDTFYALEQEYRKQAQLAAQRGDYRRAAFIYGKLLRDYHAAAAVLAQGGLHRDAAILYEKQLHDMGAAARQYEAAGEVDRALQLYRQQGEHLRAAQLLRRIGEEEQALAEYLHAADVMVERGGGHYHAGELLLNQAQRPDLALGYYRSGWERGRDTGTGAGCAVRLAQLHTRAGEAAQVLAVVEEAEQFFRQRGHEEQAGEFFNEIVRLAEQPVLAAQRDELRDRALLLLAGKLRDNPDAARANHLISRLFGSNTHWAAPLVKDARHAVRAREPAQENAAPLQAVTIHVRTCITELTALCQAASSGYLFFGFANGELARYDIKTGEIYYMRGWGNPVQALACSDDGSVLVLLGGRYEHLLSSMAPEDALHPLADFPITKGDAQPVLCPYIATFREDRLQIVAVWDGLGVTYRHAHSLALHGHFAISEAEPDAVLLFPRLSTKSELGAIIVANGLITHFTQGSQVERVLSWRPGRPKRSSLRQPSISTLAKGVGGLELSAVDEAGVVHWTDVRFHDGIMSTAETRSFDGKKFRATALVRSGIVAAVTDDAIFWLNGWESGIRVYAQRPAACANAVACFAHEGTRELVVVTADSACHRFPQPF